MAGILRVRTVLSGWVGGPGLTTFYFKPTEATLALDAAAATARVRAAMDVFKTAVPAGMSMQVSGQCDLVDEVDGKLLGGASVADPAVVIGTAAGTFGPTQVMAGLVLDTGVVLDGHRVRGRAFLGPISTAFTIFASPPAAILTNMAATGVALTTVSPPSAVTPIGVWHRPVFNKTTTPPTLVRAGQLRTVTSSRAALKWFTLRSRRD